MIEDSRGRKPTGVRGHGASESQIGVTGRLCALVAVLISYCTSRLLPHLEIHARLRHIIRKPIGQPPVFVGGASSLPRQHRQVAPRQLA